MHSPYRIPLNGHMRKRKGFKYKPQMGFDRKGLDRNGFNINGVDELGSNRNGELACERKAKQSIRENPWNIYHASAEFRNKYEIMLECVKADTNTY